MALPGWSAELMFYPDPSDFHPDIQPLSIEAQRETPLVNLELE
jgi:hypothetical protein